MKLFTKSVVAAVLGAALVLLGSGQQAKAASYSVTGTTGYTLTNFADVDLTVAGFDTLKGTLTGVSITIVTSATTSIQVSSIGASAGSVYSEVTLHLSGASFSKTSVVDIPNTVDEDTGRVVGLSYSLAATGQTTVAASSTGTASKTLTSSSFDEFSTDEVALTLSGSTDTILRTSNGNTSTQQNTYTAVAVTVTYTYTPTAVPEPATWAMIFGGVGTLVLVQRMRRHREA